mmetsp:Transcript_11876/g.18367  ORF Transcript_11876/g.18367 Transcript_11876/m.18367 type:complete len:213 (+) Transcript_11876:159-797(+)
METLTNSDTPTLVTNLEVMHILAERIENRDADQSDKPQKSKRRQHPKLKHRDWIEDEVYSYLQQTPSANLDPKRMPQLVANLRGKKIPTADSQKKLENGDKSEIKKNPITPASDESFGLTDAETLQILNLMPTEPVEIHLMIEELHSRMTDEKRDELLEIISSYAASAEDTTDANMEEVDQSCPSENGHVNGHSEAMELEETSETAIKDEPS